MRIGSQAGLPWSLAKRPSKVSSCGSSGAVGLVIHDRPAKIEHVAIDVHAGAGLLAARERLLPAVADAEGERRQAARQQVLIDVHVAAGRGAVVGRGRRSGRCRRR